jgi:DNA polymerase gamma 1
VLGQLASKPLPRTPLLGNMLTAPMCPANCGGDFVTGRSNWSIQSSARDQGDCLMVAYEWLCRKHNIDSRVIFLLHDEYVTITDRQDVDVAAWLFSVAHAWTWAYSNEAMGIYDMCSVGVWFDDILINKCLRKTHNWKTNTPTNPDEDMPDGDVILEWDLPYKNLATLKLARQVCPELYAVEQLTGLDEQPVYVRPE